MLDRVRKLLAKAEHPTTPAPEAEALSAKAEELIARYAIDQALLADAGEVKQTPESRSVTIPAPYTVPKATLLNAVAKAYDVKVILHRRRGEDDACTMVGYPSDLDAVEMLFTSLLMQATTAMLHENDYGQARSFRHAFILAFAGRVAERLAETRKRTRQEVVAERGTGAELVLVDRSKDVERAYEDLFPKTRSIRTSTSNRHGVSRGVAAGNAANLSAGRGGVRGGKRALC